MDWAKESVLKLYNLGIINGKGDQLFAPNDVLTRAEFAKIAVLALGGIQDVEVTEFADVDSNDWSYPYIASAYHMNLINGMGDGTFGGGLSITREDMAVVLSRMVSISGITMTQGGTEFRDESDISDYAKDAVAALNRAGIINGVGDNRFDPKGITTRAQAAVVFDRFLNVLNRN